MSLAEKGGVMIAWTHEKLRRCRTCSVPSPGGTSSFSDLPASSPESPASCGKLAALGEGLGFWEDFRSAQDLEVSP